MVSLIWEKYKKTKRVKLHITYILMTDRLCPITWNIIIIWNMMSGVLYMMCMMHVHQEVDLLNDREKDVNLLVNRDVL